MPKHIIEHAVLGALATVLLAGSAPATAADSVADFYKGKQVRLIIGQPAGGTVDLLVRAVARHMTKHVPGNPTFLPQNMDGAGGRIAANHLYNVAPKDGSVIGNVPQGAPMDQVRGEEGVQYDVSKFQWIGNPLAVNSIMLVWTASGLKTWDDVKAKGGLICGGSAPATPAITNPTTVKNLTGVDMRIISGYQGNNDAALAMERGETNCLGATDLPASQVLFPTQMKDGKVSILVQLGTDKDPAISTFAGRDIPLISEFATTDLDRKVLNLLNSGITFGRPLLAPPGVPTDRIQALRRAFDATMKDPEFLAEAEKQNAVPVPIAGERLQELAIEATKTGPDVVARAAELTKLGEMGSAKK